MMIAFALWQFKRGYSTDRSGRPPDRHYNAFDGEPYAPLDDAIQSLGVELKLTGAKPKSRASMRRKKRPQRKPIRRQIVVPDTGKRF